MISGKELVEWGFIPGKWFAGAIEVARRMDAAGESRDAIFDHVKTLVPVTVELAPRTNSIPFKVFIDPENDVERENTAAVVATMDELMRLPTVVSGAVMPDACPAGTIPVGGVVATKDAIHPGFHSADICCSMAITVFKRAEKMPRLLDTAQSITKFGPGGRNDGVFKMPPWLVSKFEKNQFLHDLIETGNSHLGTQGDGNHFLFAGTLRSTGQTAIVTHHGSRGVGATLYKRGMAAAKRHTAIVSPRTPAQASWLDINTDVGRDYWEALQIVRLWTKENHFQIHDAIARRHGNKVQDQFWNEHNFVFQRNDGLFYHAKGATPSFKGFSPDDAGSTLIPLNMSEPILIADHKPNEFALGFAPHGAGRNMSRTRYLADVIGDTPVADVLAKETKGLDVRFFMGEPDLSELPAAYKSAPQVVGQIARHKLATIVDYVDPYGCIMAGDWEKSMPWRQKKENRSDG